MLGRRRFQGVNAPVGKGARRQFGKFRAVDAVFHQRHGVDVEVRLTVPGSTHFLQAVLGGGIEIGIVDHGRFDGHEMSALRKIDRGEAVARYQIEFRVQSDGLTDAGVENCQVDAGSGPVSQDVATKLDVLGELIADVAGRRRLIGDAVGLHELVECPHEGLCRLVGVRSRHATCMCRNPTGDLLNDRILVRPRRRSGCRGRC